MISHQKPEARGTLVTQGQQVGQQGKAREKKQFHTQQSHLQNLQKMEENKHTGAETTERLWQAEEMLKEALRDKSL